MPEPLKECLLSLETAKESYVSPSPFYEQYLAQVRDEVVEDLPSLVVKT